MASVNKCIHDDKDNILWPLAKYTRLVGTALEIPGAPEQTMFIVYNKNVCYLTVVYNKVSVLEEFSLIKPPRPIVKSKERDVFFQVGAMDGTTLNRFRVKFVSSAVHASFLKIISFFVTILPIKIMNNPIDFGQSQSQCYAETQGSSQLSAFSGDGSSQKSLVFTVPPEPAYDANAKTYDAKAKQNLILDTSLNTNFGSGRAAEKRDTSGQPGSSAKSLNFFKKSKNADQTVPSVRSAADDLEVSTRSTHSSLPWQYKAISDKNNATKNTVDVGIQTEPYLSVNEVLENSSLLMKYMTAKLQDQQFLQLVERCTLVYDLAVDASEALSGGRTIEVVQSGTVPGFGETSEHQRTAKDG